MQPDDWLGRLISEYVQATRALSQRLGAAFAQSSLLQGRRDKAIPRSGRTADGLVFNFHGAGCWISDGQLSVDFDFLPDGQVDGFDAWRLHVFTEENPALVGVRSHEEVQLALELLAKLGRVLPVEGTSLYRRRTLWVQP
ncbi:MAG TPA: hypothetical protein VE153_17500 [Myxococcus sp.]|jgi:hypothetical protein|nr:hypothetical protein [Myxococcus sp.]